MSQQSFSIDPNIHTVIMAVPSTRQRRRERLLQRKQDQEQGRRRNRNYAVLRSESSSSSSVRFLCVSFIAVTIHIWTLSLSSSSHKNFGGGCAVDALLLNHPLQTHPATATTTVPSSICRERTCSRQRRRARYDSESTMFISSTTDQTSGYCRSSARSTLMVLGAKPSPTSFFDLDAIEAFEATMIEQEQQQQQQREENDETNGIDSEQTSSIIDRSKTDRYLKVLHVPSELDGERIDAALSKLEPTLSRSACGNLISTGCVRQITIAEEGETVPTDKKIDNNDDVGKVVDRKSHKVVGGTTLLVTIPETERPTHIVAQDLPLDVVFEDEHMIVINKAAGMVVHPAAGNWDGTVVNALAYYLQNESPFGEGDFGRIQLDRDDIGYDTEEDGNVDADDGDLAAEPSSIRPGIVHRLDKGTTGILVVAKTEQALAKLSESFAKRQVQKTYLAITVGNAGKDVVIDKPIGRHPIHRQRMRVVPDARSRQGQRPKRRGISSSGRGGAGPSGGSSRGKRALSYVDTIAFDGKLGLAKVRIETGRTHQIRVHLKDRRTPIYGDDVYGITEWNKILQKTKGISRPLLHAYRLRLRHPIHGDEVMEFVAPMDDPMSEVARSILSKGGTVDGEDIGEVYTDGDDDDLSQAFQNDP